MKQEKGRLCPRPPGPEAWGAEASVNSCSQLSQISRLRTSKHTQAGAIDFIESVNEEFPFRIKEVRIDNGREFQAKFHGNVADKGIRHACIKPASPQLNGKVERSHRSNQEEFYQLLTYKDDVDLEARLKEWENFHNFSRPPGAFKGKSPYELRGAQRRYITKTRVVSPDQRHHSCGAVMAP